MSQPTVDLPADPEIKQLAHDIAREDNEWTIAFLLDLYEFLEKFDSENHTNLNDLNKRGSRTEYDFSNLLEFLEMNDYIEKHKGSPNTTYTLESEGQ
jgi:hypothetical protein